MRVRYEDTIVWCLTCRQKSSAEIALNELMVARTSPCGSLNGVGSASAEVVLDKKEDDAFDGAPRADAPQNNNHGAGDDKNCNFVTEWHLESEVIEWFRANSENHEQYGNFSIEGGGDEYEMPFILQDRLQMEFADVKGCLQAQIAELEQERESSQHAFDKFRERARASLVKSASEQKATELKLVALQEQLKETKAQSALEKSKIVRLEAKQKSDLESLERAINGEQNVIILYVTRIILLR